MPLPVRAVPCAEAPEDTLQKGREKPKPLPSLSVVSGKHNGNKPKAAADFPSPIQMLSLHVLLRVALTPEQLRIKPDCWKINNQ